MGCTETALASPWAACRAATVSSCCLQIRRQHIQGMGIDISVGESLDEVVDLLERAAAPFQDLTWDRIFPMPTAGALAGVRLLQPCAPNCGIL